MAQPLDEIQTLVLAAANRWTIAQALAQDYPEMAKRFINEYNGILAALAKRKVDLNVR